eukprot:gene6655-biopygen1068
MPSNSGYEAMWARQPVQWDEKQDMCLSSAPQWLSTAEPRWGDGWGEESWQQHEHRDTWGQHTKQETCEEWEQQIWGPPNDHQKLLFPPTEMHYEDDIVATDRFPVHFEQETSTMALKPTMAPPISHWPENRRSNDGVPEEWDQATLISAPVGPFPCDIVYPATQENDCQWLQGTSRTEQAVSSFFSHDSLFPSIQ